MIRKLKIMLLTALAVTAFGALASAAQAAVFTAPGAVAGATTTGDAVKDGTGKTSHHVFVIGNTATTSTVSFTCEEVTGTGHIIGPESNEVTVKGQFKGCSAAGQAITVTNTGCLLRITANREVHGAAEVAGGCKHGNTPIDVEFTGCKVEIGVQSIANAGTFTNLGGTAGVTVSPSVSHKITYNAVGAACNYGTTANGSYVTGNTIITATRPVGTAVAAIWDA